MKTLLAIIFILVCFPSISTYGYGDSIKVYFKQGLSVLDVNFRENRRSISDLKEILDSCSRDVNVSNVRINIRGGASVEGRYGFNQKLSEERTEAVVEYLLIECDDILFKVRNIDKQPVGIDWNCLIDLVRQSPDMPYRDDILILLEEVPDMPEKYGKVPDSWLEHFKHVADGVPYRWMYEHLFPQMRHATVSIYLEEFPAFSKMNFRNAEIPVAHPEHKLPEILPETPEWQKAFQVGLKTNLLYDALLVPNIGIELGLWNRWSMTVNWMYAWWNSDPAHWYWRIYGGNLEFRYWFGDRLDKKTFEGHHVGIYGQMLTYDFETGGRGYLADKWTYAAGISYGYSLPITNNLNLDFSIGFGYMGGVYSEYLPMDDCYVWQVTKKRQFFGPTKAEVSLVWLIDFNRNIKKRR